MIRPASMRMAVLTRKFSHGEARRRNLFNTEISQKPITTLTSNTFASLDRIALNVTDPCSSYLNENESALNLIRKIIKSASVQQIAITKIMGSFRLFTMDPLGTISLETLISKI